MNATAERPAKAKQQRPKRLWRLLAGKHYENNPVEGLPDLEFNPGDQFESSDDLLRLNAKGYPPKFELLEKHRTGFDPVALRKRPDETDAQHSARVQAMLESDEADFQSRVNPAKEAPDINKMSVKDLTAFAAEEEIDLRGAISKEEILRRVKEALKL